MLLPPNDQTSYPHIRRENRFRECYNRDKEWKKLDAWTPRCVLPQKQVRVIRATADTGSSFTKFRWVTGKGFWPTDPPARNIPGITQHGIIASCRYVAVTNVVVRSENVFFRSLLYTLYMRVQERTGSQVTRVRCLAGDIGSSVLELIIRQLARTRVDGVGYWPWWPALKTASVNERLMTWCEVVEGGDSNHKWYVARKTV